MLEQLLSDISHDPQKPASIVSDMEVIEDEIELRGAGMTSENATDRDPESEKEEVQNSDVSNSVESVEDATKFEAAETCDFIVSNDLIDVKTSLVEVMGKPLPKFCGSSASVIATSCYEENILKESQVRSPGDCENSSTECTESNDELTGKPWNFPFGRICNGKFSSSGNATSENASVEAVHDEKPQEDASSETLCDLLDQTALQNNKLTTEIENETGMEPELVRNMTIEENRIFYNKEEIFYKHEGGEIFYNKKGKKGKEKSEMESGKPAGSGSGSEEIKCLLCCMRNKPFSVKGMMEVLKDESGLFSSEGVGLNTARQQLWIFFRNNLSRPIWVAGRRRGNPKCECRISKEDSPFREMQKALQKAGNSHSNADESVWEGPNLKLAGGETMRLFDIRQSRNSAEDCCVQGYRKGVLAFSSNNIDYGDIWDSTKGYPGEGHGTRKSKLKQKRKQKDAYEKERKENESKLIRLAVEAKKGRIDNVKEAIQFLETVVDQTEMIQNEGETKIAETLSYAEQDGKRIIGSVMSLNARGMNGKLYDENGLEFYAFMNKHQVMATCMQDHKMRECDKQRLLKNMEYCVTNMRPNKSITMQEGLQGRSSIRHGGAASILGGKLAVYGGENIIDPRGWGRISGRKVVGLKDHGSISDLAVVSYYGPSPAAGEGPQWTCQENRLGSVPKSHRKDNPRQQGFQRSKNDGTGVARK